MLELRPRVLVILVEGCAGCCSLLPCVFLILWLLAELHYKVYR